MVRLLEIFKLRAAHLVSLIEHAVRDRFGARAEDTKLLTEPELENFIANAKTAADHERIAQHFDAKAAQWETAANTEQELHRYYRRNADPAVCNTVVKELRTAAQESRQLAADRREMAKDAK